MSEKQPLYTTPTPEASPTNKRTSEHRLFGQEGIPPETLKTLSKSLLESYKEDPIAAAKQLSNLRRAGIKPRGKRVNEIFEYLKNDIDKYKDDVPQLANYLKHLKHIGAINKISDEHKKLINREIQNKTSKDIRNVSQLSQLCIDAKYVGAKDNFDDVQEYLATDLKKQLKTPGNEAKTALKMARLKYLGLPFAVGEVAKEKENITSKMLSKLGITKKLNELKRKNRWPQFASLRICTNYLQSPENLSADDKEAALLKLKEIKEKAEKTNDWKLYTLFAGHLGTLNKYEIDFREVQEEELGQEIVTGLDGSDTVIQSTEQSSEDTVIMTNDETKNKDKDLRNELEESNSDEEKPASVVVEVTTEDTADIKADVNRAAQDKIIIPETALFSKEEIEALENTAQAFQDQNTATEKDEENNIEVAVTHIQEPLISTIEKPQELEEFLEQPLPQWIVDILNQELDNIIERSSGNLIQDDNYKDLVDYFKDNDNQLHFSKVHEKITKGDPIKTILSDLESDIDKDFNKDQSWLQSKNKNVDSKSVKKLANHESVQNTLDLYVLQSLFEKAAFNNERQDTAESALLEKISSLCEIYRIVSELKCLKYTINQENFQPGFIESNINYLIKEKNNEVWPDSIHDYLDENIKGLQNHVYPTQLGLESPKKKTSGWGRLGHFGKWIWNKIPD